MGDDHEFCNTNLGLGISLDDFVPKRDHQKLKNSSKICFDLSFPLHFKDDDDDQEMETEGSSSKTLDGKEEIQITACNIMINNDDSSNNNNNNGGIRKKLRLTREQSTVLEDSFEKNKTLNMVQKQALAEKLNLKPRQVEVWFQNRRARIKLKQTEVDCEFLKKCRENLSNENRRLKIEVQELRSSFNSIEKTTPFFVQLQKAATTIASTCPSCGKMERSKGSSGDDIVKHERSMADADVADHIHKPKHNQCGLKFLS